MGDDVVIGLKIPINLVDLDLSKKYNEYLSQFGVEINENKSYDTDNLSGNLVCDFLSRTYCKFGKLAAPAKNVVTTLFFNKPWSTQEDIGISNIMDNLEYFRSRNGDIPDIEVYFSQYSD